jgi:hypothetical protein
MASFVGEGEGLAGRTYDPATAHQTRSLGDVVWSARWANAIDLGEDLTARVGASLAAGPNSSGEDRDSLIYGGHLALRWRPAGGVRGWPFVSWETEAIARDAQVAASTDDPDGIPASGDETDHAADTLEDWGLFTQVLVGFHPGWAAGLRYELASVGGREADPLRDDRTRISPLLTWQPTEFSRLRLQYNYDRADHLADDHAHSVWLGLDIVLGTHPPHVF